MQLTERVEVIFAISHEIAAQVKSPHVTILHLLFALLCDEEGAFENSTYQPGEGSESLLWSLMKRYGEPAPFSWALRQTIQDAAKQAAQSMATQAAQSAAIEATQLLSPTQPAAAAINAIPTPDTSVDSLPPAPPAPARPWLSWWRFREKKPRQSPMPSPPTSSTSSQVRVEPPPDPTPTPPVAPPTPSEPSTPADAVPSPEYLSVMASARKKQSEMQDTYMSPHHLLLSILEVKAIQDLFNQPPFSAKVIKGLVEEDKRHSKATTRMAGAKLKYLSKYASNLTDLAVEGKLDPVIGRDAEIRRTIRILSRKTKNSPVLIGEPGVGKTAIVEGLAQRIAQKDAPTNLHAKVFSLDMGALIAGASSRGEYEERVKGVLGDILTSEASGDPIILFIDEIHLITAGKSQSGSTAGMDAANLLKPALARGQLRCIGATTLAEYREHIEKDGALERRFAQVLVNEASVDDAVTILRGIREKYETHHGVLIRDSTLVTAVELAHRYLTHRRLPDSAIDLVDEACASARVVRETCPEDLDKNVREKGRLEMDIACLEKSLGQESKEATKFTIRERLGHARKLLGETISKVGALSEAERSQGETYDELRRTRQRLAQLRKIQSQQAGSSSQGSQTEEEIESLQGKLVSLEDQIRARSNGSRDDISPESIARVVERSTGIPVQSLLSSEKDNLLRLGDRLGRKVIGQAQAVKAVSSAIQRARNGLTDDTRPIASFLFSGATGTGKTFLSKMLAECMFNSQDAMVRIDASEYNASHSISRLIGSPPGYVGYDQGGQLTEYVRRNPFCIILIDEIEKACTEFHTLFLQVLDDARLTDGKGRVVDFKNTIIIMTSNLGAGLREDDALDIIYRRFPLEFINRIDDIIIFNNLGVSEIQRVLDSQIVDLEQRIRKKNMSLDFDPSAKELLSRRAHEDRMGARPLMREITREVISPISTLLLQHEMEEHALIRVWAEDGQIHVDMDASARPPPAPVEQSSPVSTEEGPMEGSSRTRSAATTSRLHGLREAGKGLLGKTF